MRSVTDCIREPANIPAAVRVLIHQPVEPLGCRFLLGSVMLANRDEALRDTNEVACLRQIRAFHDVLGDGARQIIRRHISNIGGQQRERRSVRFQISL